MTREQNRRNCPQAAAAMDALAEFKPRVVWWKENGHVLGKPQ